MRNTTQTANKKRKKRNYSETCYLRYYYYYFIAQRLPFCRCAKGATPPTSRQSVEGELGSTWSGQEKKESKAWKRKAKEVEGNSIQFNSKGKETSRESEKK